LRGQLKKAESDDQQAEREVEILKRKAVRESEQLKWDALREVRSSATIWVFYWTILPQYGEKLVLLSQAGTSIVAVLPAIPPTPTMPYTGGKSTGAIRASLQRALDNYKTGHINLPPHVTEPELSRSDTLSFGESHASELSSIDSEASSLAAAHITPSSEVKPLPSSGSPQALSPSPIDVTALNNSPAPVPMPAVETVPDPANSTQNLPAVTPTIAETGIPVPSGPSSGPSSGSLLDIRGQGSAPSVTPAVADQKYGSAPSVTPAVAGQKYESANEEKKRLAAAYSQQASTEVAPAAQGPSQATPTLQSESAEEEKERLEREERERILRGDPNPSSKDDDQDLPPYTEPSLWWQVQLEEFNVTVPTKLNWSRVCDDKLYLRNLSGPQDECNCDM
jgi:hypothetical protein